MYHIVIVQKSQIYTQKHKMLDNILYFCHTDFIVFLRVFKLKSLFYIIDTKTH